VIVINNIKSGLQALIMYHAYDVYNK